MAGTNYSADKAAYNAQINSDITTQIDPNSISPVEVGSGYTDLADMLEPYILRINNNALLFGTSAPSNSLGADLDIYYQQTNPINIYRKVSGSWVLQGSLPINFVLPEGNLTVKTSISGFTVTATKGGWVIANTVYQKATQTQIIASAADLNFGRIDVIYANTSNNIIYLQGTASSTPTAPALPPNTILIDQIIVPSQSSGNDPYLLFGGEDPTASGLNFADSTGLISGGVLSINANPALFNVSAGTAFFVDFTNPILPVKKTVSFGPASGVTITGLTSTPSTYIGVNGDGDIVQQNIPFTNTQRRSIAVLGILIHTNLATLNAINAQGAIILAPADQLHDLMNAIGPLNLTGNKYSAASNNLTIQKTAGNIFKFGCNSSDYTNPHVASQSAGNPVTFRYRTRNGEVGGDITSIIPGSYDNAGVITAVPVNQFTIQHITMFQSGLTRIQYGQNLYATISEAQAAAFSEAFAVESNIAENGIFRAYLIVKSNATDLSNTTQAAFLEVPKFGGTSGNAGSALTSANIIAALGYTPLSPTTGIQNQLTTVQTASQWTNVVRISGNIIANYAELSQSGNTQLNLTGVNYAWSINGFSQIFNSSIWVQNNLFRLNETSAVANSVSQELQFQSRDAVGSPNIASFTLAGGNEGVLNILVPKVKFVTNGSIVLPRGTTGQRPTILQDGEFRKNNTIGGLEYYDLSTASWRNILDGSGTSNFVPKWGDSNTLTNSLIFDNGTNVGIGTTTPQAKLEIVGNVLISGLATGIIFDNPASGSAGITHKTSGVDIWSINKGAGDGSENYNIYNFGRSNTDISVNNSTGKVGFNTSSPTETVDINGTLRVVSRSGTPVNALGVDSNGKIVNMTSLSIGIRSIAVTDTVLSSDGTILVNATSGNINVNLPAATTVAGRIFIIKRIVTASNTITIDPNGSETIDGSATFSLSTLNQHIIIQSDGSNWFIIGT